MWIAFHLSSIYNRHTLPPFWKKSPVLYVQLLHNFVLIAAYVATVVAHVVRGEGC